MEASAGGPFRYAAEECLTIIASWIPSILGIALRALLYRILIRGQGIFMIESGVRLRGMSFIEINEGVYIDRGSYLHGRPGGLRLGRGTRLMHGAVLHCYNFRGLERSGISIGKNCVIGINTVITGQGAVVLEDNVIIGPGVSIMPVNHNFGDASRPVREQGISGKGVHIGEGAWVGAGAIILDGVKIGKGAVVAAGSVVTQDVPEMSLAAGNPATVVRNWEST